MQQSVQVTNGNMKKFGVIVVSYDNAFYKELDALRLKVFSKENIPVFIAYNGPGPAYLNENEMYMANNNINPTMYNKFLMASEHLLKNKWKDFDYVVRVNSSTFLNPRVLSDTIQNLPASNCYAGFDLFEKYIWGTCIIFDKNLLLKIIENGVLVPGTIKSYLNDDFVLFDLMQEWNVPRTVLPQPSCFEQFASITPNGFNSIYEGVSLDIDYNKQVKDLAVRVKNYFVPNRSELDLHLWKKLTEAYFNVYH